MPFRLVLTLIALGLAMAVTVSPAAAGVAVGSADLSITKTDAPDPVLPGGALVYTITIDNLGPDAAANVEVNDTLSASLAIDLVEITGGWGAVTVNTPGGNHLQVLFDGLMPVAATATIAITVTVDPGTPPGTNFGSAAFVSSSTFDPNLSNNSAITQTQVGPVMTPTPAASLPNAAMNSSADASPLLALGFAALLIGSLGTLAFANVRRR